MFDRLANFPWWILLPLVAIDLVLKGISLWRAAKNGQNYWFIALLLINSLGIVPIVYLLFFDKRSKKDKN